MPIHALKQKLTNGEVGARHILRKHHHGPVSGANISHRRGFQRGKAPRCLGSHIAHHAVDHAADHLRRQALRDRIRRSGTGGGQSLTNHRQGTDLIQGEQARAQPIIQIMVVIGDIIRDGSDLRLGRGIARQIQRMARIIFGDIGRWPAQGAIMLGQAFQRFPSQVQTIKPGVTGFELRHDAERLRIMVKPAIRLHRCIQRIFPGMSEGRMAQIMRKRQRLGQILIQAQKSRDGPRNLRHFNGMGQARAEMITFVIDKHLRLVLQAPKGRGVDDTVPIPLKG